MNRKFLFFGIALFVVAIVSGMIAERTNDPFWEKWLTRICGWSAGAGLVVWFRFFRGLYLARRSTNNLPQSK